MTFLTMRFFLWVGVAVGAMAALWWIADTVGDVREASVRADIRAAADKVNVNLDEHANAQDAIDVIVAAKVAEAVAEAKRVPSEFKYTAEQAAALNKIRGAAQ